jgi:apolipoprotein N-acyltransferase
VVTNPSITPIGAGAASTTITLQTSITTGSLMMGRSGVYFAVLPVGMLTALALFAGRRRRLVGRIFVLAMAACLIAVAGCGGKGNSSTGPTTLTTAPGTYSLTIMATSGTTTHSIPWTVIVQ